MFKSLYNITGNLDIIFSKDFIPISMDIDREFSNLAKKINDVATTIQNNDNNYKKVSESKSQFIANATHEFRTPLFSLKGYIETLQNGAINDNKVNRIFLKKMYHQIERLEKLFNNLIDISKIESNNIIINSDEILLNNIMLYLSDNFSELAKNKGLTFFVPNTAKLYVKGDIELLKICFSNLVDNAIKYSKEGTVSVSVKNWGNSVHIKVIDNGIGIAEEYHQNIFDRFFRVEDSRSQDTGGHGLGLSIVKHILKGHSSEIFVKSTLGQGSIFSFNLNKIVPNN